MNISGVKNRLIVVLGSILLFYVGSQLGYWFFYKNIPLLSDANNSKLGILSYLFLLIELIGLFVSFFLLVKGFEFFNVQISTTPGVFSNKAIKLYIALFLSGLFASIGFRGITDILSQLIFFIIKH